MNFVNAFKKTAALKQAEAPAPGSNMGQLFSGMRKTFGNAPKPPTPPPAPKNISTGQTVGSLIGNPFG